MERKLEVNRRIFKLMGNLNMIPWNFVHRGLKATAAASKLRWNAWLLTFALCLVYTVYINVTLMQTLMHGLRNARYDQLGVHLLRSLMSTSFTYWAHEFFVAHSEKHEMLYNYVQANPGMLAKCSV